MSMEVWGAQGSGGCGTRQEGVMEGEKEDGEGRRMERGG